MSDRMRAAQPSSHPWCKARARRPDQGNARARALPPRASVDANQRFGGGIMGSTDVSSATSAEATGQIGTDMALEVVTVPVTDIDRAKTFYASLGWRFDIDLVVSDDFRTVQFTPPHSACSVQFGKGTSTAEPGSAAGMILVVDDIDAARDDLVSRGIDVGEVEERKPPGLEDAPGRSYFARASFSDPDGNTWQLQEVTTRLPGRVWDD